MVVDRTDISAVKEKVCLKNRACKNAFSANPVTETKRPEQPQFQINTFLYRILCYIEYSYASVLYTFILLNNFTTDPMFILNELQSYSLTAQ